MSNRAIRRARRAPRHPVSPRREVQLPFAGVSLPSWASVALGVGAPLLLIGVLGWPLLFTSATFGKDWLNHLWYVWHQSVAIRDGHLPSLFLDYSGGVFYPYYAFYGGTLYALTGGLSLALGNAPLETYILTYLLGFATAYGGWYWMARMFGLGGWLAHIPGLIFVTSASYLSMVYGLVDWPEFLAVSMMPLMIASGLSVLRADRLRLWPSAALTGSSIVFFGSHLLTTLWGTTLLLLVACAMVVFIPEARHRITRAGVLRVAALVVPSMLVSAWFLLPAIAYGPHTVIANSYRHFRKLLQAEMYVVAMRHLFTLSRAKASGTAVTLALPVLAIAWVLGSMAILLTTGRRGLWMKMLFVVASATLLVLVIMTHANLILALPRIYATLQFSFRLESYVLLGISGMLLIALVLTGDGEPYVMHWRWLLAPIAVISIIGAITQVGAFYQGQNRSIALRSFRSPVYEQEGLLDYVDDELPLVKAPLPKVDFPPSTAHGDHAVVLARPPSGNRVDTNLRASAGLIGISGARIVGVDPQANDVLELEPSTGPSRSLGTRDPSSKSARIEVGSSDSLPVIAGRILTLVSLIALLVAFGLIFIRRHHVDGREDVQA